MTYLLDVNALLALGYAEHVHHARVAQWLHGLRTYNAKELLLATCAITEVGFVRIASGKVGLAQSVSEAREDLRNLKAGKIFSFIVDDADVERLPAWVRKSVQTTDGHLLDLAREHGARLATLDEAIPGAELIPPLGGWGLEEQPAIYGAAA